ncbi:hypothetical protein GSI_15606 [Ganoderma sinense ZZ0214-1]|uniref:PDZ GRASP-type domain-containing protein n=1 Tax=Ganoderma sinense ZZ0214-1 TaxID=1077348 RepID=A0A2G8RN26_9APHY|nr:hypothetical protein GSI_15606 [Ganoderma sinense ZZ0214-1]
MGAGQSTASQVPPRALHVLRVTPSSPASQTTIEPYFDFVVGYKGDSLDTYNTIDASELERIVESHEGLTINLLVWNSKSQETRTVPITPSRDWSSPHANLPDPQEPEATERKPSLLGLSMRICQPEFAMDNVWHVLDVLEGSPAESAGLVPYGDWIIGWSGGVLSAEGDFYDVVEAHIDKPLRVYVYSYDFDTIREVVVIPNRHWGGEGLLGCVFGYVPSVSELARNAASSTLDHRFGLLHRIPPLPADREPGTIPPELAAEDEEDDYEEHQLFVPADLPGAAETPEELEERMQWEQEEWERVQSYGHNYVHDHDPAYQTSSAYPGRAAAARLRLRWMSRRPIHLAHTSKSMSITMSMDMLIAMITTATTTTTTTTTMVTTMVMTTITVMTTTMPGTTIATTTISTTKTPTDTLRTRRPSTPQSPNRTRTRRPPSRQSPARPNPPGPWQTQPQPRAHAPRRPRKRARSAGWHT